MPPLQRLARATVRGYSILSLLLAVQPLALAQGRYLPQPNANGDYLRTRHRQWRVVDPDPEGLNCRWLEGVDQDREWDAYIDLEMMSWPVVVRFQAGTLLRASTRFNGWSIVTDNRGLPWLKVALGNDRLCLVRANRRFIRPH